MTIGIAEWLLFPKPLRVENHTKGVVGGLFDRSYFRRVMRRMRSAIHVVKNILTELSEPFVRVAWIGDRSDVSGQNAKGSGHC